MHYLFLWGDVTGTYSIPTNYITSPEYAENDADDNYYTMLKEMITFLKCWWVDFPLPMPVNLLQ